MMSQHERRRAAMSHAFKYQRYKADVAEYIEWAISQMSPKQQLEGTPVSSGHRSDPTAHAAIRLADMPEHIRVKALWIRAIEAAWKECRVDEELGYLFEKNFRLTGEPLGPEHNTAVRNQIVEALGISTSTFYTRLTEAADVLVYHAAKRKLL